MSLKPSFRCSQPGQRKKRTNRGRATRLLRFETFEDRRMLSFTPAVNFDDIASPSAIATADFNKDGNLDLATAGNGNVRVRLGDGAGGFGAAQELAAGTIGPYQIEVAHFNNDENLDILVMYDDVAVGTSLLMGKGDGTFQPAVFTYSSWLEITAVAVGHFNNDDNIDLVVSLFEWDAYGGRFQVRPGDGQGVFTGSDSHPYQPSLSTVDNLAAVDLNNDGKLDVVTAGVTVMLGNGDGTLQSEVTYPAAVGGNPYPRALATGDFTGDENPDVIVVGNSVALLRGRGDGSLEAPLYHSANGTTHTAVATADFNADGKLDAVVTDGDTGTLSLMLGNGDGTLNYVGAFATGSLPSGIAVGDFNRDGRPDVAVANRLSHTVSVLLNDGHWAAPPALPGDYNQDNHVDAADYILWRMTLGNNVARFSGADGSGNGIVDQDDYGVWRARFGQTLGDGTMLPLASQPPIEDSPRPASPDVNATAVSPNYPASVSSVETEPAAQQLVTFVGAQTNPSPKPAAANTGPEAVSSRTTTPQHRADALLAWLATRNSAWRPAELNDRQTVADDEPPSGEPTNRFLEPLDSAFASLAL